jgi:hypothetical protein
MHHSTSSLPYLLELCSRILLEKRASFQLVNKFPAFYGTRRFITEFICSPHLSLSWSAQRSKLPHIPLPEFPFKHYAPIYALVFQMVSFPQVPQSKPCKHLSSPIRATCPTYLIILDFITRTIFGEQYSPFTSSLCTTVPCSLYFLCHSPSVTWQHCYGLVFTQPSIFSELSIAHALWLDQLVTFMTYVQKIHGSKPY